MRKSKLPPDWEVYSSNRKGPKGARSASAWTYAATGLGLGALLGVAVFFWPSDGAPAQAALVSRTFTLCHTGGGTNCVVDGDTVWLDGIKIRVADIDAPETHPPRCEKEADLGSKATQRLLALVNAGPLEAVPTGNRDADRYGRKLRVLVRNGRSLGDQLVQEGLARTWDGARRPWCN